MPAAFDYAVVRVVPRVDRGEFVNVGVILVCQTREFLDCALSDDLDRVQRLAPDVDLETIEAHLLAFERVCRGDKTAGPVGALTLRERFHWLVHPRSTVIQTSPAHGGETDDPAKALARLFTTMVPAP